MVLNASLGNRGNVSLDFALFALAEEGSGRVHTQGRFVPVKLLYHLRISHCASVADLE